MNCESILKSDLLDIIFENRNKKYGAYELRKFYSARLIKAFLIMLIVLSILAVCSFLKNENTSTLHVYDGYVLGNVPPNSKPAELLIKKGKRGANILHIIKTSGSPVIVHNTDSIKNIPDSDISFLDPNNLDGNTDGTAMVQSTILNSSTTDVHSQPEINIIPDVTEPLDHADVMPQFPGGINALRKFLEKNLIKPNQTEHFEDVNVKIRMVVGGDGKVQNFEIVEDGGEPFTSEVIRVLKIMPDWIPGKTNGQNVPVYCTIPVKFIAED